MSLPIKTQPSVISFSSTCPDITITDYGSSTDSVPYVPTVSPRSPRFFDFLWTAAMKRTEQVQPMNKKEQPKPKATIEVEDKLPSTPIVVTWTIKALHLVYCCGIIFTISQLQSRIITDVSTLLSLLIGLPLVVDNLRYSGFLTSPSIAMYASKLCFFAHEVLTPLGLLYIPLIFVNYIPYHEARSWLFPVVLMVSEPEPTFTYLPCLNTKPGLSALYSYSILYPSGERFLCVSGMVTILSHGWVENDHRQRHPSMSSQSHITCCVNTHFYASHRHHFMLWLRVL